MRLGIYFGRHFGGGGGIALYSRSLLRNYLKLLSLSENSNLELYLYGESTILTPELKQEIAALNGSALNGANRRVFLRPLAEGPGRKAGILLDQAALFLRSLRDRLDLLHATPNFGPVLTFCPRVVTVHDLYQAYPPAPARPSPKNFFYRTLFSLQLPFVKRIILDTPSVGEELAERYSIPPERRTVVPLGLDDDVVPFVTASSAETLRAALDSLGIQPGYVLLFGSSDPRKNFREALRAVRPMSASARVVVKLLDVGAEPLVRDELPEALIVRGWLDRERLFALYGGARVLLFPSLAEGFGFPALEALALGASLVSPELDCLKGLETKLFFPCDPLSLESIGAALRDALEHSPVESLEARTGRIRDSIGRFHTMDRAAKETLALCRELAAGSEMI